MKLMRLFFIVTLLCTKISVGTDSFNGVLSKLNNPFDTAQWSKIAAPVVDVGISHWPHVTVLGLGLLGVYAKIQYNKEKKPQKTLEKFEQEVLQKYVSCESDGKQFIKETKQEPSVTVEVSQQLKFGEDSIPGRRTDVPSNKTTTYYKLQNATDCSEVLGSIGTVYSKYSKNNFYDLNNAQQKDPEFIGEHLLRAHCELQEQANSSNRLCTKYKWIGGRALFGATLVCVIPTLSKFAYRWSGFCT